MKEFFEKHNRDCVQAIVLDSEGDVQVELIGTVSAKENFLVL